MLHSVYNKDYNKAGLITAPSTTGIAFSNRQNSVPNLNLDEERKEIRIHRPFLIGVAGGTASGKTTVCEEIIKCLACTRVAIIGMDSFYKPLTKLQRANVGDYNFDHPDAFDWELLIKTMQDISRGFVVRIPTYDFITHSRTEDYKIFYPGDVVMFEGILSLHKPKLRELFKLKIFVSTDADIRVCRRLQRDIVSRGRTVEDVLRQYQKTVKPSFDHFCAPTQSFADIIVPHGGENKVAIDLMVTHIRSQLHLRGRIAMDAQNCIVPAPLNVEQNLKISMDLLRKLKSSGDDQIVQSILISPYHEMIRKVLTQAANQNPHNVAILCLVQDPFVEELAAKLHIEKIYFLSKPRGLCGLSPKLGPMQSPEVSSRAEAENQSFFVPLLLSEPGSSDDGENSSFEENEQILGTSDFKTTFLNQTDALKFFNADSHVYVLDAVTFTGNRVRSALIWLLEKAKNTNVTCLNMISSHLGLNLLAHSFRFANFYTLSQLPELNDTWDLPSEGKWIRKLLNPKREESSSPFRHMLQEKRDEEKRDIEKERERPITQSTI